MNARPVCAFTFHWFGRLNNRHAVIHSLTGPKWPFGRCRFYFYDAS